LTNACNDHQACYFAGAVGGVGQFDQRLQ
jgi:hypothetical protein